MPRLFPNNFLNLILLIITFLVLSFGCNGQSDSLTKSSTDDIYFPGFFDQDIARDDGKITNNGKKYISEFQILSEVIESLAGGTISKDKWYTESER